jgi:subtilisin family serine protease
MVRSGKLAQIDAARRVSAVPFLTYELRDDIYVVPGDAAPLVSSGVLDRRLFNVSGLVRQGYDDRRSAVLPLLAEYPDSRSLSQAAPVGARRIRTLTSVNVAVVMASKSEAPRFWAAIKGTGARLAGGVRRLWLDGKVTAALDASVPQVGAPAAWKAGYTGKGVTIAVLDSGYDTDHPDLAGRVDASRNFIGFGTVEDKTGHGTHVASIALGSGAASKGKYRGVAPDARLAVGKVLNDEGSGQVSWMIAGMEWAAAEAKAKVVNMSLSGPPTDGTDPLSQAVNVLSRKHGTLFAIAAGNYGEDDSVTTPAAADEALAVASVTKTDELSEFSSRGPRVIDSAMKPELAAPGSDIVAARATGTAPSDAVDENYSRRSGTSMATPHIAGAAAILAQQHPDWSGARLKAALISTAKPVDGQGPTAVGAGRLDIERATTQAVQASTGRVDAYLKWPNVGLPPRAHTVTYHNAGSAPVELHLSMALANRGGQPAPDGMATLGASRITVPAGGQATGSVVVRPEPGISDTYTGVLLASSSDGAVTVRTPVSVFQEPERYDLTVKLTNRAGATPGPEGAYFDVVNTETGEIVTQRDGARQRLPRGRYAVLAEVTDVRPGREPSRTFLANPEVALNADTTIQLDARKAKPISIKVDQPAANGGVHGVYQQVKVPGAQTPVELAFLGKPGFDDLYAASTPGVRSDLYSFSNWLHAEEARVALTAVSPQQYQVSAEWFVDSPEPDMDTTFSAVHGGAGTPEELAKVDARGKLVILKLRPDELEDILIERIRNIAAAGGKVVYLPAGERVMAARRAGAKAANLYGLPFVVGYGPTADQFAVDVLGGRASAKLTTQATQKYRYEVVASERGAIPGVLRYYPKTKDLVAVRTKSHGSTPGLRSHSSRVRLNKVEIWQPGPTRAPAQTARTEYFSPGVWTMENGGNGDDFEVLSSVPQEFKAGRNETIEWNKPVYGPQFTGLVKGPSAELPFASIVNGFMDITMPLTGDAAGHRRSPGSTEEGSMTLYRDGESLGTSPGAGWGGFNVSEGRGSYRLAVSNTRTQPWWPLATTVACEWTFAADWQPDKRVVLPLLSVVIDPELDLRNTAPGSTAFAIPVRVLRQSGTGTPTVKSLAVEVSHDDGKTWQQAEVASASGGWRVTVQHPAAGYVSLRAKAADTDGNTVEQTVIRAYKLR